MSAGELSQAAQCLLSGGVIAHATEGVWGFACLATADAGILRILEIKQRAADQGLLLIGASAQMFAAELNALSDAKHRTRVEHSWPGPHTWVLPNIGYTKLVVGNHKGVACRVPGHAQARELCALVGRPLVSTSANRSGQPACLTQAAVAAEFSNEIDLLLEGEVINPGQPSAIYALDGTPLRAPAPVAQVPST